MNRRVINFRKDIFPDHFCRRTGLQDMPIMQNRDTIRNPYSQIQIMDDHDYRQAFFLTDAPFKIQKGNIHTKT